MRKAKILSLALIVLLVALALGVFMLPAAAEESLPAAGEVMTEDVVVDEYGTIPKKYANQTDYPFVIFDKDGVCRGGYKYWLYIGEDINGDGTNDDNDRQGAFVDMHKYVGGTILMRRDYNIIKANDKWMSHLNGTMNIDLGGFTLNTGSSVLFNVNNRHISASPVFNVTNGTIKLTGSPLIQSYSSSASYNGRSNRINFEGVTIGYAAGATAGTIINSGAGVAGVLNTTYVTFTDCNFDFHTNYTDTDATKNKTLTFVDMSANTANANHTINITINGGNFRVLDFNKNLTLSKLGSSDTLYWSKNEAGVYPTVEVSDWKAMPTGSFYSEANTALSVYFREWKTVGTATNRVFSFFADADCFNVEDYGLVPNEYANAEDYPFFLFQKGKFFAAEEYWSNELAGADANYRGVLITARKFAGNGDSAINVLLRRNYEETNGRDKWFAHNAGTVNLNLNEFTLRNGTFPLFANAFNHASADPTWNVSNGTILIYKGALISSYSNGNSKYNGRTATINFSNVNIGFAEETNQSALVVASAGASGVSNTANITFSDCYFDLRTNVTDTDANKNTKITFVNTSAYATNANHSMNITVNGGNIRVRNYKNNLIMSNINANLDKLVFAKGTDSNYPAFMADDYTAMPTGTFVNANGESLTPFFRGFKTDTLNAATQQFGYFADADCFNVEGYGLVPNVYANEEDYPFVTFKNGKFFAADECWLSERTENGTLIRFGALVTIRKDSVNSEVLLRSDYDYDGTVRNDWLGHASTGTTNINLNNHTMTTLSGQPLLRVYSQYNSRNPVYNLYDGTLLVKKSVIVNAVASGKDGPQAFGINFNNVKFGFAQDATAKSFVTDSNGTVVNNTSMSFTNCEFDAVTNAPSGVAPFDLDNTDINTVNITFNGSSIKANTWAGVLTKSENETLTFAKFDGKYLTVKLQKGASAPTGTYVDNGIDVESADDDITLAFKKVSGTETTDIYELVIEAAANLDFTPKASVTLDSNLIFNIYIPKHESLTSVTVSEIAGFKLDDYSLTEDGKYYIVPVELSAYEAAKTLTLVVNLTVNGSPIKGTFTFSTVKYAEKLIEMNTSDKEVTLAKDMLAYVRSAYAFFNGTTVPEIDEVLDTYASTTVINTADAKKTVTGLTGATFVLGARPAVRFYFSGAYAYNLFSFKVGERALEITDDNYNASENYVEFSLFAYEMTEVFSYEIADTEIKGEYNLISYYAYASGNGENDYKGDNKATLTDVTAKFYNYCASARAYRDSVINK